jgi:ubiquinone/menaquinone biosynthesis C-methylase UbiE
VQTRKEGCTANCELFGRYAEYFESHVVPLWQDVYDLLVERSSVRRGESIVDVGTGTGEVALRVARLVGARGNVVAIDTEGNMLEIAERKAHEARVRNVEFRRMSVEALDLGDKSFDGVVGNYSVCCCHDYRSALQECLRVLKRGGRMVFNQSGLSDPPEFVQAYGLFEEYKTAHPSARLRQYRDDNAHQKLSVEKYRDPFLTLSLMREVGFRDVEATITQRAIRYRSPEAFIDRLLGFNWRNEAEEIPMNELTEFRSKAPKAISQSSPRRGFVVRDDMVFFSGVRG